MLQIDKQFIVNYVFFNTFLLIIFGYTTNMYTVEFQKRGLPHVHLLLFLHANNKYPSPNDIDNIISAEIPSQKDDPETQMVITYHTKVRLRRIIHRDARN